MKSRLFVLGLVLLFLAPFAHAAGFDIRYSLRTGDLNGDGRTDIYLRYSPNVVMIPMDDLTVPIPIRSDVGDFVMLQNASGAFDMLTSISSAQRALLNQWSAQPGTNFVRKDFNADGYADVLIKAAALITGSKNAIIFAPSTKGAPPSVLRNVDTSLSQFIADVSGWSDNPNYFSSGVSVQCGIVYLWTLYYDPEYGYYWQLEPYLVCQYVFDPAGFSIPAIDFLNNLVPVMNDGKIVAQSENAARIGDILQQILGITVFNRVFQDGGFDTYESDCRTVDQSFPEYQLCLEYERFARLIDILRDLGREAIDPVRCSQGVAHHYQITPQDATSYRMCTIGGILQSYCSTANVYHEQLTHPVTGYIFNDTPIHDGQEGKARLFFVSGGDLVFHVNKPILWHQNETKENHIFHPGWVNRQTVVVDGDKVFITTEGGGTGDCATFNEYFGVAVFKYVDLVIHDHLQNGITATHKPIP